MCATKKYQYFFGLMTQDLLLEKHAGIFVTQFYFLLHLIIVPKCRVIFVLMPEEKHICRYTKIVINFHFYPLEKQKYNPILKSRARKT